MQKITMFLAAMLFLTVPLFAQTEDLNQQTTKRSEADADTEELQKLSELPEAIKNARDAGTEEDEIQKIVKGVKDKKLTADEGVATIRTLEENTGQGRSNNGIADFVFQQKAKGVQGRELGQSIKMELQQRHRIKNEEKKQDQKAEPQQIKKTEGNKELEKEKIKKQDAEKKTEKANDQNKVKLEEQDSKKGEKKSTEDGDEVPKAAGKKQSKKATEKKSDEDAHDPVRDDKATK